MLRNVRDKLHDKAPAVLTRETPGLICETYWNLCRELVVLKRRKNHLSDNYGQWVINKLSCDTTGCDKQACYAELEADFDFIEHNDVVVEMVP